MRYELRVLDMSIKDEIDIIKRSSGDASAATSFMSMYMWRNVYGSKIVCQDGFYALKVDAEGDNIWFFPTGDDQARIAFIEDRLRAGGLKLLYASKEDVEFLEKHFKGKMTATEAPDESEYLYSVDEFIRFNGAKFKHNRRVINKLNSEHDLSVCPLTQDRVALVDELLHEQIANYDERGKLLTRGDELDLSVFDDIDANRITGLVINDGGSPVATIAGAPITDTVYDLMISGHKQGYEDILLYCIQQMAIALEGKTIYMNAEEDLGIEGLRRWKNMLQPAMMIDMWECDQI